MEKPLVLLMTLLFSICLVAQSTLLINYQAIIRDPANNLVQNKAVGVRINILRDSSAVSSIYTETKTPVTNANGLIHIEFGGGQGFANIDWAKGPYFIKIETDPAGGSNYSMEGISRLMSVPYSLHSQTAGIAQVADSARYAKKALLADSARFVRMPDGVSSVAIRNDSLYVSYYSGGTLNAGYLGKGAAGAFLPTISTVGVSGFSYTKCFADGQVSASGGEFVMSRGFCLSTLTAPTISDSSIVMGSGQGSFRSEIRGLAPNTKYYIRAFATNIVGTVYGNELNFKTLSLTVPVLITDTVYNISSASAMSRGTITDDGGSLILQSGLCWSLQPNPTLTDSKVLTSVIVGPFNAQMNGLASNTTYFVRAFATNAQGTAYGLEKSFKTNILPLASVTTSSVTNVQQTNAMSGGNVTSDNGSSVTNRGLCWGTTTAPTTSGPKYIENGGLGSFVATLTGLTASTLYYVRAFATNAAGTVYGNEFSFTTSALSAPIITTTAITGISSNVAGSGGTITSDGGLAISSKGVCWGLNPMPTIADSQTNEGIGTSSFKSSMSGLALVTKYYVRAYATNSLGTSYGNELSFTTTNLTYTTPTAPIVGTTPIVSNGITTAVCGGYVSDERGSSVTARGVCWSINANPTLADSFSVNGSGPGYFRSIVNGLTGCSTTFYVRAYATNNSGTNYGNVVTISTGQFTSLSTDSVTGFGTSLGSVTALSGGTADDQGGCSIIQKGVCWSLTPAPSISNFITTDGPGNGAFVSNMTDLYPNKTYYVRSYTTSSAGTFYGPERSFSALAPSTPYLGQSYAGGIVFYVDSTGMHGLVAATVDQEVFPWGLSGTFTGVTSTDVGSGAINTAYLVALSGEVDSPAKACDNLVLNGYSDWFLPSIDELKLMYLKLHSMGFGGFMSNFYWSSSEKNSISAYAANYHLGSFNYTNKTSSYLSRAVRAF